MKEEWRVIPDFKDYHVSNMGRIKSFRQKNHQGRILKLNVDTHGYHNIKLWNSKKPKTRMVHLLVAEAFGIREKDKQVDHINGRRTDNRVSNLRACTHGQNTVNRHSTKYEFRGVRKRYGRYQARVSHNKELKTLGTFDTEEEAHLMYCFTLIDIHGEFANVPYGENYE